MTFNWIDFIEVSQYIFNKPIKEKTEACYRTTINRAYYAAYWSARDHYHVIKGHYLYLKKPHWDIINFYKNMNLISIYRNLKDLYTDRCSADYNEPELVRINYQHAALQAITRARNIIDEINGLKNP